MSKNSKKQFNIYHETISYDYNKSKASFYNIKNINQKSRKYFSDEYIMKFNENLWNCIATAVRENFDKTGDTIFYDYQFSCYFALQHISINGNEQLLNNNCISWLVRDVSYGVIHALKVNDKLLSKQLEYGYIISIIRRINFKTMLLSIIYNIRYNIVIELLEVFNAIIKNPKHWVHKSLTIQGLIYRLSIAIDKIYRVYILSKRNANHLISKRIVNLFKLKTKACVPYLNNIFEKCVKHSLCINHCPLTGKNIKILKMLGKIESATLTKCGNEYCGKQYNYYKYEKTKKELSCIIRQGYNVYRKNKWYKCSRCKIEMYCSRKCQKYDWKYGHSAYCQEYY